MPKNIAVCGIYKNCAAVAEAVRSLKYAGFSPEDISVLFQEDCGDTIFATWRNKAPESAEAMAHRHLAIRGILGWLRNIGSLTIPSIGPSIAAGPIMAALTGAGELSENVITEVLKSMGVREDHVVQYLDRLKKGEALLSIHADDPNLRKNGKKILECTHAEEIGHEKESA